MDKKGQIRYNICGKMLCGRDWLCNFNKHALPQEQSQTGLTKLIFFSSIFIWLRSTTHTLTHTRKTYKFSFGVQKRNFVFLSSLLQISQIESESDIFVFICSILYVSCSSTEQSHTHCVEHREKWLNFWNWHKWTALHFNQWRENDTSSKRAMSVQQQQQQQQRERTNKKKQETLIPLSCALAVLDTHPKWCDNDIELKIAAFFAVFLLILLFCSIYWIEQQSV